jgi:ABC-2 type transport system ATP-binding protein
LPAVLRILESRGIGVANIALSRASLDDVFLRATGHSLRDEAVTADSGAAGAGAKE